MQNLVIDNTGLSLKVTARNVVMADGSDPKANTWDVSVDTIQLDLMHSAFRRAYVAGDVFLPNDDKDELRYVGQASEGGDFSFSVALNEPKIIDWESWDGQLTLLPNSSLTLLNDDAKGGWNVEADLYGNVALGIAPTASFTVPDVIFEKFQLKSYHPYVGIGAGGHFGITGAEVKLGGFGVELNRLAFVMGSGVKTGQYGIETDATIELVGGSGGFSGTGGATVWGKVEEVRDGLDFAYEDTEVNKIGLGMKIPGVEISGVIDWYKDDPVFGRGFQGGLQGRFDGVGYELAVAGMFGRVNNHAYFFVDGMVGFPIASSIPIVTPLHLTGLGGGVYYHMTRAEQGLSTQTIDFFSPVTNAARGEGLSGVRYVPTAQKTLGLKLMTNIATVPSPLVMNGAAMLEAEFNLSTLGLNSISFNGSAAFLTPTLPNGHPLPNADPVVAVDLAIRYRNAQPRNLSAVMDGYLNYVGLIKGAGTNNGRANHIGQIAFEAKATGWKLWMGTPQDPLAVSFPFGASIATYMDMGSSLPAFPAIDAKYRGLGLGDISAPPGMSGFMHGLEFQFPSGGGKKNFSVWRIRAQAAAEFGYNLILSNSLGCRGRTNYGLANWYLKGNAYAYLFGAVQFGYGWDDYFEKTANLASLSAIAALQVEAPNPSYIAGGARIEYDIAFWEGSKQVTFSFGDNCSLYDLPPSPLESQLFLPFSELIVGTDPSSGLEDVDPALTPTIVLVDGYRKPIDVAVGDGQRTFRITEVPGSLKLRSLTTGQLLPNPAIDRSKTRNNDLVFLDPASVDLRYGQQYELSFTFRLEERKGGSWQPFLDDDGKGFVHERSLQFRTEPMPDFELIRRGQPLDGTESFSPVDSFTLTLSYYRLRSFLQQKELLKYPDPDFRVVVDTARAYEVAADGITLSDPIEGIVALRGRSNATLDLLPERVLNGETDYRLIVSLRPQFREDNRWNDVTLAGDLYRERYVADFTTGPRPEELDPAMIARSYPEHLQYNTYRDQRPGDNYIVLTQSLQRIFGRGWLYNGDSLQVRYSDNVTNQLVATAMAKVNERSILWPALPASLGLDKTYRLDLVIVSSGDAAVPTPTASPTDEGNTVIRTRTTYVLQQESSGSSPLERAARTLANQERADAGALPLGKVFYTSYFRTSAYPTFAEKVAGLQLGEPVSEDVSGVQSPRYVHSSFQAISDSIIFPYVENLSVQDMGFVATRSSNSPGEFFSKQELETPKRGGQTAHNKVSLSYGYSSYYRTLREDVFNFVTSQTVSDCYAANQTGTTTIREQVPTNTLRIVQSVAAPELEPTSGHQLSLLNGAPPPTGTGPEAQTQPGALFPSVEEIRNGFLLPGLNAQVPAHPDTYVTLRSSLPHAAAVQYNNSWLFRYRAMTRANINPCDFEDGGNTNISNADLEAATRTPDYGGIIQNVNDAMKAAWVMDQLGYGGGGIPITTGNGGGGLPITTGNAGGGLPVTGGNTQIDVVHTPIGVQTNTTVITAGGVGVTTQFGAESMNVNQFNNAQMVTDQNVTTPPDQQFPQTGFAQGYELPFSLRMAVRQLQNGPTMPDLPDPTGADIRAVIQYVVQDVNGQVETYAAPALQMSGSTSTTPIFKASRGE
jgi:hypothetical protein